MSWFDWFNTSSWSEDLEAAIDQASTWIATTSTARNWAQIDPLADDAAAALVAQAAEEADDAGGFWAALSSIWGSRTLATGWDKLGDTFRSAQGTAATVEEARDEGSAASILGGTAAGAADDVVEGATFLRSYGPWIALVLVVVFVIVLAWQWGKK